MKRRPYAAQRNFGSSQPSQASRTASMLSMLASAKDLSGWTPEKLRACFGGTLKDCEYHLAIAQQRAASW